MNDAQKATTQKRSHRETIDLPAGKCALVADRYEKVGRIGEGSYGVVYKAIDRQTNCTVALKRCIPHHESSDGFPITTLREIESLKLCSKHPNIVGLHQVAVSESGGVFLVFEHCDKDLAAILDDYYAKHKSSPFPEASVKRLFLQLLSALEYLHDHHLIHRDLKLSNLLYKEGSLKLADFGLSRPFSTGMHALTPTVASLWYRPPELLLGATTYTQSIDMWASGCIWCELLIGSPLFPGKTEMEQINKIFKALGVPSEWPASLKDLLLTTSIGLLPTPTKELLDRFAFLQVTGLRMLTSLLNYEPEQRWTASRALESPYFLDKPFPTPESEMRRFV
ncbi:cyclin-dependent kinase 10 [Fistulifera solaris]|uniref:Cyclin-dependent kinase 2 homolog n=1 Tax=Fistulifera solaris TaxID=1519565 RepID=A0A1Z5JM72_FISSO|nr:cyclin-dependent kinase 10 [Fistulifera solaris]|eukprot:GAX14881.1 cyclin-dependent kinase 10 [Fistulifera solaris]